MNFLLPGGEARRLSLEDLQVVRDWLEDFIEDQLEVSEEFRAKIQSAKQEIARGA